MLEKNVLISFRFIKGAGDTRAVDRLEKASLSHRKRQSHVMKFITTHEAYRERKESNHRVNIEESHNLWNASTRLPRTSSDSLIGVDVSQHENGLLRDKSWPRRAKPNPQKISNRSCDKNWRASYRRRRRPSFEMRGPKVQCGKSAWKTRAEEENPLKTPKPMKIN